MKVGNAYILYPPISLSTVLNKKAQFTYIIIPFLYELYLVSSRHQVYLHEHKSPDLRHPIGNSQRGNSWEIIVINTTKKKIGQFFHVIGMNQTIMLLVINTTNQLSI